MLTVKDLSFILNVSKPTIQKVINKHNIKPVEIVQNKYRYYSFEDAELIIKEINPNYAELDELKTKYENTAKPTENTAKTIENSANDCKKSQNVAKDCQKSQNEDNMQLMLEMLKAEIEKKDAELENRRQENQQLQDKLHAAYEQIADLAQKAHYISAAAATSEIIDKQQAAEAGEPTAAKVNLKHQQKRNGFHFGKNRDIINKNQKEGIL